MKGEGQIFGAHHVESSYLPISLAVRDTERYLRLSRE